MIESTGNPKVKYVRRLQREKRFRQREGVFVVEGARWIRDLFAQGFLPHTLFYTTSWAKDPQEGALLNSLAERATLVTEDVMAALSDTETPAGVLAVLSQPALPLPAAPTLLLILDQVRDPGNLGTLVRTAAAAGVDALLLAPGCVDPYNPKVVRATMGALLRLPILEMGWEAIAAAVTGLQVWMADADADALYTAVDWRQPSALVVGSEAHGPGMAARTLAQGSVRIPMRRATESLNAAMAAGIILFEAVRQRDSQQLI